MLGMRPLGFFSAWPLAINGKPGVSRGRKATEPTQGLAGLPNREKIIMRKSFKVMTAVAVAGLAFASGSAFTGAGVTNSAGAGFVGGSVDQTITGADLTAVDYTYSGNGTVTSVQLTFAAGVDGKTATAVLGGGSGTQLDCGTGVIASNTVTCTTAGWTGATSLTVGVS